MLEWIKNNPILSAVIASVFVLGVVVVVLLVLSTKSKRKAKKAFLKGSNDATHEFEKLIKGKDDEV